MSKTLKKSLSLVLAIVMVLGLGAFNVLADDSGEVTKDAVEAENSAYTKIANGIYMDSEAYSSARNFFITSIDGLTYFQNLVNGNIEITEQIFGNVTNAYQGNIFTGKTVHLLDDINLTDVAWTPIGYVHGQDDSTTYNVDKMLFYGNFDGHNHTISNITISKHTNDVKSEVGFFGRIGAPAGQTLKNLTLKNVTVQSGSYVGAIVGNTQSNPVIFDKCTVTGQINLNGSYTGAIYGIGNGNVLNCTVTGDDGSSITGTYFAGGLVGAERCSATSNLQINSNSVSGVEIISSQFAGGLVGAPATGGGGKLEIAYNTVNDSVTLNGNDGNSNYIYCANADSSTDVNAHDNIFPQPKVAEVNGTQYSTLQDAINAAESGAEIQLLNDFAITEYIDVEKSITITGDATNRTKINCTASRMLRVTTDNVNVVLNNIEFIGDNNKCERGVQVDGGKKNVSLTLNNVKIAGDTYYAINMCSDTQVALTINNSYIEGWGALNLWGNEYTVNVENTTLKGVNDKGYNADGWNNFGTVVLEGDTTGQTDEHVENCTVNLTNCTIIADTTAQGNKQFAILFNDPSNSNTVNVMGENTVIELKNGDCYLVENSSDTNTLNITGGKFSSKPDASYIAAGYKAYATKNGKYEVKPFVKVTTDATTGETTTTVNVSNKTEDNSGADKVVTYTFTDSNITDTANNTTTVAVTEKDNLTVGNVGESALLAEAITAAGAETSVNVVLSMFKKTVDIPSGTDAVAADVAFEIHPKATITTTTTGSATATEVSTVTLSKLDEAVNVTVTATNAGTSKYATVWHYASGTDAAPVKVGSYAVTNNTVTFPAQTFSVYTLTYSDDESTLYQGQLGYVLTATGTDADSDSIVDADVGGTVTVDVYLKNNYTEDVGITAGSFTLGIPDGLTYKTFTAEGTGTTIDTTKAATQGTIQFYREATDTLTIAQGDKVKVGKLTFDVEAATGTHNLKYGDVLNIGVSAGEMHVTATTTDLTMATATPTKVEIVTQYTITWAGLYSDVNTTTTNDTTTVGVNLTPTHDDPARTGFTFAGWNPTVVKATSDTTYTAQWTANEYALTLPATGVTAKVGTTESVTTAKTNDTVTLTITPETGYKVKTVTVTKTGETETVTVDGTGNSRTFTMPPYAVTVEVTYDVDAKVVFADYKYGNASTEDATMLVLVGVDENMIVNGKALKLNDDEMFKTTDENYLTLLNDNGTETADTYATAYVYIVSNAETVNGIISKLTVGDGNNEVIARDGDVNGINSVNMTDVGIVDDLIYQRVSAATVQMRLEADMITTDGGGTSMFGSLADIVAIIQTINSGN